MTKEKHCNTLANQLRTIWVMQNKDKLMIRTECSFDDGAIGIGQRPMEDLPRIVDDSEGFGLDGQLEPRRRR